MRLNPRDKLAIVIGLIAGLVLALLLGVCAPDPAMASHKHNRCPQHSRKNLTERKKVIRCWAQIRGLDANRVLRIARCESGRDLLDDYIGDTYGGTFQHAKRYWSGRAKAYGVGSYGIRNVWAQARISTGMMRGGGWGHWPVCQYA